MTKKITKHKLEIDLDTLGDLPLRPPRRKLWDLLPGFVVAFLLERGVNPKTTPYEEWVIRSAALRVYYNRFRRAIYTVNAESLTFSQANAPGSKAVN